jgi:hypothetical protein
LRKKGPPLDTARLLVTVVENARQGDKPVPGARIQIQRDGDTVASGESDNAGSFQSPPLEPGKYQVRASKIGYREESPNVALDEGQTRRVQVVLERPGPPVTSTLQVQVRGSDGEGMNRPVARAEVELLSRRGRVSTQTTDVEGRCSFTGLDHGEYELIVRHQSFDPAREPVAVNQPVVQKTVPLGRQPPPKATVTLTVLGLAQEPRVQQPAGGRSPRPGQETGRRPVGRPVPLASAEVTVLARRQKNPVAQGPTDRAGRFVVPLPAGEYLFSVTMPGYQRNRVEVEVGSADVHERIVLSPMPRPGPRPMPR